MGECLDSLINQKYKNLEIILINDGSSDQSGFICDEYSLKDKRIKIIHKINGGLMSAWIAGTQIATGEYFYFVDSDDWIDIDTIENLVSPLESYDYDLVTSNYVEEYEDRKITKLEKHSGTGFKKKEIETKLYPSLLNNSHFFGRDICFSRWGKLIKSNLVRENINYCNTQISFGEDVNIMFSIFLDCESIYFEQGIYYHYRQNENSIMHSYKKNMYEQVEILKNQLLKINREKINYDFSIQISDNYLCSILSLFRNESIGNNIDSNIMGTLNILKNNKYLQSSIKQTQLVDLSILDKLIILSIKLENQFFLKQLSKLYHINKKFKQKRGIH